MSRCPSWVCTFYWPHTKFYKSGGKKTIINYNDVVTDIIRHNIIILIVLKVSAVLVESFPTGVLGRWMMTRPQPGKKKKKPQPPTIRMLSIIINYNIRFSSHGN